MKSHSLQEKTLEEWELIFFPPRHTLCLEIEGKVLVVCGREVGLRKGVGGCGAFSAPVFCRHPGTFGCELIGGCKFIEGNSASFSYLPRWDWVF